VIVTATSPRGGGDPAAEARAVGDAAIAAARQAGRRLFVVGGAGSLNLPDGRPLAETLPDAYRPEALAMRGVLNSLKASDIDWTFFSPAAMISPGTKTGTYRLGTTTLLSNDKGREPHQRRGLRRRARQRAGAARAPRSQMTIAY
jgi:putative NADH-flavin reductase